MSPVPPMELAAAMVSVLLSDAAVALLLVSAPAPLIPVPEITNALLMLWPFRSSAAPELTVADRVPSATGLPSLSVPALTVVPL